MSDVKPSRRAKAAETRARVVDAAREEFLAHGFHGTTIAAVARRAGVAAQTVYFVFHTKAQLISEVIDAQVMAPDPATGQALPPQLTPWWREMEAEPDAAAALRRFVQGAAPLFERAAGVSEVLRAAALADEELAAIHAHHDALQREGFGQVVAGLADKGPLRAGLTTETATDVLLTVLGDSTYHQLRTERGWSHEAVVAWWDDVLPGLLLARDE